MEWVETTAKTVEEAKNQALDQLGVAEDDAEIVVLDEPRPGLFGRVRGEARVRARVRPTTPRPKLDRRDRKKKDQRDAGTRTAAGTSESADLDGIDGADDHSDAPRAKSTTTRERSARGGRTAKARGSRPGGPAARDAETENAAETKNEADVDVDADADADRSPDLAADGGVGGNGSSGSRTPGAGGARRRGRRGGAGRRDDVGVSDSSDESDGPDESLDGANGSESNSETPARAGDKEDMVDAAQVGEEARTFVQGVVDAFGLTGTTAVQQDGDDLEVTVDGADLGLLVGPRGTTLQALQELTRVAAQRRLGDHDTRLRVDVGGYRVRRREALSKFAHQVATQVVADGIAKRLEPMSSADRKVIHDALSGLDGVVTRSEGDDPNRCVVIAPAVASDPAAD